MDFDSFFENGKKKKLFASLATKLNNSIFEINSFLRSELSTTKIMAWKMKIEAIGKMRYTEVS